MFGLGTGEVVVILLFALLIFGPTKIPEMARLIARGLREFAKARHQVDTALSDLRQELDLRLELEPGPTPARNAVPKDGVSQGEPPNPLPVAEGDDYLGASAGSGERSAAHDPYGLEGGEPEDYLGAAR
jgi:TatA/E family protein of Tat protein translocase